MASTSQHLTDFSEDLVGKGFDVTVLTARRGYANTKSLYAARETYCGVDIIRVWPFSFGRGSRISRILDAVFLNVAFALRLLFLSRFDTIVAMTSPPLVAWFALYVAKLKRSRFVYWMMDLNPDEAIEAGWIKKGSFEARILGACLQYVIRRSDKIIVLDRFMKERLLKKGAPKDRIEIIPPWAHSEDLETVEHKGNVFRKQHKLADKFVVMYSGNHSVCHPLDTLLEAAFKLRDEPSIAFVFIGGGERVGDVTSFREKHGLSNIMQLPYVGRSEVKYSLSAADVHAVVMGDRFVGIVHPCKIYNILSLGRHVVYIGPKGSHVGDILSGHDDIGCQVLQGDVDELAKVISRLKNAHSAENGKPNKEAQALANKFQRSKISAALSKAILG
ncbi:MAG: glycosyltransferase family 4 protein [Candidatus Omnitrophota bacterium]|nr:glycosyltransferase family 4 protein [Candidatus Omnitrophota bacterium]